MCNAWNHPADCTCGWGGEGHLGGGGNTGHTVAHDLTRKNSSHLRSHNWGIIGGEDFYKPTTCPECEALVYFVRHNGGSVWLDDLGQPWPKHPCFDNDFSEIRQEMINFAASNLHLVTEVSIISQFDKGLITVQVSDGRRLAGEFKYEGDIRNWLGQVVHIDKENKFDTIECTKLKKIYGHFTEFSSFSR